MDKEIVYKYQDAEDNTGLFRYVLMKQCAELSKWMPDVFEKDEKHSMWRVLEQTVMIDGQRQSLSNAMKIYTKSVFDALNEGDSSKIKFYRFLS